MNTGYSSIHSCNLFLVLFGYFASIDNSWKKIKESGASKSGFLEYLEVLWASRLTSTAFLAEIHVSISWICSFGCESKVHVTVIDGLSGWFVEGFKNVPGSYRSRTYITQRTCRLSKKHKHQTNKKLEVLSSKLSIFYFYSCND